MKAILNLYEWWEYRSASQHFLITLLVIAVIYFIFSNLFFLSLSESTAALQQQALANEKIVHRLQGQEDQLHFLIKNTSISELIKQNSALQQQLTESNKQLGYYAQSRGASSQIINFLKILLSSNRELTLINLQHSTTTLAPAAGGKQLFQQNINLQLTGNFFSTLNYLEALEKSPWHFFNDEFDYQVDNYPNAKILLKLHTLNI